MVEPSRALIIRFSSVGDIAQCLAVADDLKQNSTPWHISWLVRADFAELVKLSPNIDRVIAFERADGFFGLVRLAARLSQEPFTHIYDAHNNLRSHLFTFMFFTLKLCRMDFKWRFQRRSKLRIRRLLFFYLGLPTLPQPFQGMKSFLSPIHSWSSMNGKLPPPPQLVDQHNQTIVLAPSAAWELKRWPPEYFKKLIDLLPQFQFAVVGGPVDSFIREIVSTDTSKVKNLSGQMSWRETALRIAQSALVISNDTGVLHLADWLGRPAIALIGPTAFGHPSRPSSTTLEVQLPCQPCSKDGRGVCKNPIFKRCLFDITPEAVAQRTREILL